MGQIMAQILQAMGQIRLQIMGHINSIVGQMGAHKGVFQKQNPPHLSW